ncbi:MAG: transposase [SAR324 cluster bacterium]|nr:transposase [SAR324 cluster bacterium]
MGDQREKDRATRFRRFLCHLKREMRTDKILLICDNATFHKAQWLTDWVKQQQSWLQLEFLPPYSPDFNPIERLWRWMKTEFIHNQCWKTAKDLKQSMENLIREMQTGLWNLTSLMKKENERFTSIVEYYQVAEFQLFNCADDSHYTQKQLA